MVFGADNGKHTRTSQSSIEKKKYLQKKASTFFLEIVVSVFVKVLKFVELSCFNWSLMTIWTCVICVFEIIEGKKFLLCEGLTVISSLFLVSNPLKAPSSIVKRVLLSCQLKYFDAKKLSALLRKKNFKKNRKKSDASLVT